MGSNWIMTMLVVALFGPAPATRAADPHPPSAIRSADEACHPLLMAAECLRHQARLATLAGPERQGYLAEMDALLRDREQACSRHRLAEMVILAPEAKSKQRF